MAGTGVPSRRMAPTPIIAAAMCDSGARSPDAPTDPCDGITGTRSCASIASSMAIVSLCTPDAPCASEASFNASISRAIGAGIASPTPAACDSTMLRCSADRSASPILIEASFPNPVLIPYTGAPRASSIRTVAALASIAGWQDGSSRGVPPRYRARQSARVALPGERSTMLIVRETPSDEDG